MLHKKTEPLKLCVTLFKNDTSDFKKDHGSMKEKLLKVKKNNLLVIAALVWIVAGVNILHIGLEAYAEGYANF